jgi:hypothetical protein
VVWGKHSTSKNFHQILSNIRTLDSHTYFTLVSYLPSCFYRRVREVLARSSSLLISFPGMPPVMHRSIPCGLCSGGWTVGAALTQSPNPRCRHYFHHGCILHHLLHTSSSCPECHRMFVTVDGNYDNDSMDNDEG